MKTRVHRRYETGSHCSATCTKGSKIKIKDISIGGICLETSQHIDTRNTYVMKLVTRKKNEMMLKGEVVWSSLVKSVKNKDNIYPVYNIGLKFIEQNENKNKFLEKLTERLAH